MKNAKIIFSILFLASMLTSCSSDNSAAAINGKWQGIRWEVGGKDAQRNVGSVLFQFNQDGTYQANMGKQIEKGQYEVIGNKLYTTAEGQIKKMVQISLKGTDTLIMDMNRAGAEEQLILSRK